MAAVCNLACSHAAAVVEAGGVGAAVQLLSCSSSAMAKNHAARCLKNLACHQPTLLDERAVPACVAALVDGGFGSSDQHDEKLADVEEHALIALWDSSAANRRAVRATLEQLQRGGSSPHVGIIATLLRTLPLRDKATALRVKVFGWVSVQPVLLTHCCRCDHAG